MTALLTTEQVAERVGVSIGTWNEWRRKGHTPQPVNHWQARDYRYRPSDIDAWLAGDEPAQPTGLRAVS